MLRFEDSLDELRAIRIGLGIHRATEIIKYRNAEWKKKRWIMTEAGRIEFQMAKKIRDNFIELGVATPKWISEIIERNSEAVKPIDRSKFDNEDWELWAQLMPVLRYSNVLPVIREIRLTNGVEAAMAKVQALNAEYKAART